MRRKRLRRQIVLAFVLGVLYIALFPVLSGREGYFKPVWAREIPGARLSEPTGGQRASWFRAGRWFGYVLADGSLLYAAQTLYGVALSELGFINYPKLADTFVFQDPQGRFQFAVQSFGYPLLDERGERLYSISTNLNQLSRLERDGETIWTAGFVAPISTLNLHQDECLVGLLDGTLKLIDKQGAIRQELEPGGSRIPVILASAVSPDGRRLAVVSGIDPQRLSLFARRAGGFALEQQWSLDSDFRRGLLARFTADGRFLAFEAEGGLSLLEAGRRRFAKIELSGRLLALDSSAAGILAVAERLEAGSRIVLLRPFGSPLCIGELASGELFLRFVGSSLLIGLPGALLRLDYLEG